MMIPKHVHTCPRAYYNIQYVIVRVYVSLSLRLRDLRERAEREPWSLNSEDSEQIYSK